MTSTATPFPASIQARIDEAALSRVTRMYSARLPEIFGELLQNARRAGSSQVLVSIQEAGTARVSITVTDDGAGIADPAVVLAFGANGWSADLIHREDAAGMGLLSLARCGCRISSRPLRPDPTPAPGWTTTLDASHFLGEAPAAVLADTSAPAGGGTRIDFSFATTQVHAVKELSRAALHFPLPVILSADTAAPRILEQRSFLHGAVHFETWRGITFGVFKNRFTRRTPDLNFHGHTLSVDLPAISSIDHHRWSARAEVRDCPELELVLPARQKAVENPFLADLRSAARLAIYRAMSADPDPRPAFDDWTRARAAGIRMAPPAPALVPWRPIIADLDHLHDSPCPAAIGPDPLLIRITPEAPDSQALWRAATRAGLAPRLYGPDARLAGYDWYDRLATIDAMDTVVTTQDGSTAAAAELKVSLPRPTAIRIDLLVNDCARSAEILRLDTDLSFAGEPGSWISDAVPLVTADSDIDPLTLADLLRAAFFYYSDDVEADSYETQSDHADREAWDTATRLLLSEDEALRQSITDTITRELAHLLPRDGRTLITIENRRVHVRINS